ncbi:hypothetical protein BH18ACT9_BH18ACT9_21690 [soil metagenome]
MPINSSTTCADCGFDCSATASFRASPGRSPTSSDGLTPFDAEYVALTRLQADALIMLDGPVTDAVKDLVTVAPIEDLS